MGIFKEGMGMRIAENTLLIPEYPLVLTLKIPVS
jgi:hypothetical protein